MSDRDELYIGYLPEAPPATASHVRRWTLFILIAVLGLGTAFAVLQNPFAVNGGGAKG